MDLELLLEKVPFVYHLTSVENLPTISKDRTLRSTSALVNNSSLTIQDKIDLLHSRRADHRMIDVDGSQVYIRDQKPISIKSLNKCLEGNISSGDFIKILNDRVFFWPSIKRLEIHFNRYSHENPIIFKIPLNDLIEINDEVLLCHLNSGATRCHPKWGGAPPPRGNNTFKTVCSYDEGINRLAEITILHSCLMPTTSLLGKHPNGPWNQF